MKSFFAVFLLILSLIPYAVAKNVDFAAYENYVEKLRTEFNVPGLAVGIVNKSGPLYMKGFGVRGLDSQLPVTAETQFAIGSTTKAFTATSLGILVDQGIVQWDQPIKRNYLPDFQMMDPIATEIVTIRDILTHRTGLPRHDLAWYGAPLSREELYHRIKYLNPTAGVREKVQYQNFMYMVAGLLTGRVMNTTWEAFVTENILAKIGMTNSNLSVKEIVKSADFAKPHVFVEGRPQLIPFRDIDAMGPAGSINSSVTDMGKWLRLQLNGGTLDGVEVIKASTLAEIHRPQMVTDLMGFDKLFEEFGNETYAMGWSNQTYLNKRLISHSGGIDGFTAYVALLPDHETAIVVLANSGGMVPFIAAFGYLDLVIKGQMGPWAERYRKILNRPPPVLVPPTPSPLTLEKYVGTYSHPGYGPISVSLSADTKSLVAAHYVLTMTLGHYQNHSFYPVQKELLVKSGEPYTFIVTSEGAVTGLKVKADVVSEPILFQKEMVPRLKLSASKR